MFNLELAQSQIRRDLAFLTEYGFVELPPSRSQSELVDEIASVCYANPECDRWLEVLVSRGKGRFGPAISVIVSTSDQRRIVLHNWLGRHPEIPVMPSLADGDDPAAVVNSIREYSRRLREILLGPLKGILLGQAWEEVPPDWQGLR